MQGLISWCVTLRMVISKKRLSFSHHWDRRLLLYYGNERFGTTDVRSMNKYVVGLLLLVF